MKLPDRSIARLEGVHPQLVAVVLAAAEACPEGLAFVVTEGARTQERQRQLVAEGKSQTMRSRHVPESNLLRVACAVDLAVWYDRNEDRVVGVDELSWKFPDYKRVADLIKSEAARLGVPIEWGGDWTSLKDGPHFQLPWKEFP